MEKFEKNQINEDEINHKQILKQKIVNYDTHIVKEKSKDGINLEKENYTANEFKEIIRGVEMQNTKMNFDYESSNLIQDTKYENLNTYSINLLNIEEDKISNQIINSKSNLNNQQNTFDTKPINLQQLDNNMFGLIGKYDEKNNYNNNIITNQVSDNKQNNVDMFFDFKNVNLINEENILINNKYFNNNYDYLFRNDDNNNNNNDLSNLGIENGKGNSFKITNVIQPCIKTPIEIDNEYNDNKFLYEREMNTYIRKNCYYMENNQKFIKPKMRRILLDWIQEISFQLNFKKSTFHLTISILDIFLSNYKNLDIDKLQLTGVTCLMIAAKYEVN